MRLDSARDTTSADDRDALTFVQLVAWVLVAGIVLAVISLVLQKRSHALERQPVHAFRSTEDFIRRLYAEQFCNF